MFGKSKEDKQKEKALKKIKRNQQYIESLKKEIGKKEEEIVKMGRLALKDGKVVPADNKESHKEMPEPPASTPQYQEQPMPQQQEQPMPVPPQAEHPAFQQQPLQSAPQVPPQYNTYSERPSMPSQEQYIPRAAPVSEPIDVNIVLVTGQQIKVQVPENEVGNFLGALEEAVNKQILLPIGKQMVNGRNIVFFNTS